MTVLVTGATGFIGVHLVEALASSGYDVVAVDLNPPHRAASIYLDAVKRRTRFLQVDLCVPGALIGACRGPVEAVVHAAVVTSSPQGEAEDPQRVVAVNILGTLEAMRFAQRARARRFIYISSSGVYGETDPEVPLPESHRVQLATLYTMTKYAGEQLVESVRAEAGWTAASVRIAAPYGPMERPTGARTLMSAIHTLVHAAVAGRAVRLAGAERTRDWTHARDIAKAIQLLLEAPRLDGVCYNVSSGAAAPLADVAEILTRIVPGFSWRPAPSGAADIDATQAPPRGPLDIARIRALGFVPRYGLEDGLRDTVTWVRRVGEVRTSTDSGGVG